MLDLLIKSPVRRKIMALFALNSEVELYTGQVVAELEEHPFVVGKELRSLADGGVLKKIEKGKKSFYRWNEEHLLAKELKGMLEKLRDHDSPEISAIPDLKRREEIDRNLKQVVEDLKKYYDPEKVILFGSAATGKVGSYSDIDLVVIKKTSLPYFQRISRLTELVPYDDAIDFLVYTPEEFEQATKERRFFREEILKKGKVLYEKKAA